jgi:alpha-L-fucosidase
VDSTLQANDAWFWQPPAVNPLNSIAGLVASYHASLGRNSNWLLGISPAPNGTVAPQHAALLAQLGAFLRGCYGSAPAAAGAMAAGATQLTVAPAGGGSARVNRLRLREDQTDGQLVRAYNVTAALAGGGSIVVAHGTSVGAGKFDIFAQAVEAASLSLVTDVAPRGLQLDVFFCEDPQ